MPDIIDNNAAAEKINKLIKDNFTSEEKLAEHLNMSAAALAKNLSGKASFDTEKLQAIAGFFKISYEELLYRKEGKEPSQFQLGAEGGVKTVKKLIEGGGNLAKPDIYGGYLIEYVAENHDEESFKLLAENNAYMIEKGEYYLRAAVTAICFAIKSSANYIDILNWHIDNGLRFDCEALKKVFAEIEKSQNFDAVDFLLDKKVKVTKKLFNVIKITSAQAFLDILTVCETVAANKLDKTFDYILPKLQSHLKCALIFTRHNYAYGFKKVLEILRQKGAEALLTRKDDFISCAAAAKNSETLKSLLEISPQNCDKYMVICLKEDFEEGYDYIYKKYGKSINLSQTAYYSVKYRRYEFFKQLKGLSEKDYDIALSLTAAEDVGMNMYIFEKGGRFNGAYFNGETAEKANNLIKGKE
jgi:transcriptional regulator with XRE-family HTH domain